MEDDRKMLSEDLSVPIEHEIIKGWRRKRQVLRAVQTRPDEAGHARCFQKNHSESTKGS